jgi:small subunit ribosomal protein S1
MANVTASRAEGAPATEDFAALLEESLTTSTGFEGQVVKGRVIAIENDMALVDVGLKSEGRVPLKEFTAPGGEASIKIGDTVEVFVERMENYNGEAVLSREKARREEAWSQLEKAFQEGQRVTGVIFGRVKGGFTVDLSGAVAFLPGSQVDIRPVRDVGPLMNTPQPFQILKMDRQRGNIVVSRRAVLEETRAEARSELVANLREGQVLQGVVKNITDYGAFVELEPGIEGLVHVSEMSWTKKNVHPGKIVSTSQEVDVKVLEVDEEKRRISLGLKQAQSNPWEAFAAAHPAGSVVEGEVKNATEFGLFVGLEGDVDGMVHMSDIAWGVSGEEALALHRKGETVKAQVLDVDVEKERISLGMKQLEGGGAGAGAARGGPRGGAGGVNKGETATVIVRAVQDAGLDVQVGDDGVTGFIKRTDLGRDRDEQRPERFQVGQKFDAMVSGFDRSKKPTFSIKAMQIAEEKQAVAQYGSSDSGASLGDILGAALKDAQTKAAAKPTKAEATEKPAKAEKAEKPAKAAKPAKAVKEDAAESGEQPEKAEKAEKKKKK